MSVSSENKTTKRRLVFIKRLAATTTEFYRTNFFILVASKLIILGIIIRFWAAKSSLGNPDENSSLFLLNSKDALDGHFYVMRQGLTFGGNLEALLTAPFIKFLSIDGPIWIVSLLLLVCTSVVLFKGFKHTPHKDDMRIVLALLWVCPAYFVISSVRPSGHIALEVFLSACIFATAYYAGHSLMNLKYFYAWALLSGIAFWINPVTIATTIICLFWIIKSAPTLRKSKFNTAAFFVLGSSLLFMHVIDNLFEHGSLFDKHNISTLSMLTKRPVTSLAQVFGLRTFDSATLIDSRDSIFLVIVMLVVTLLILAFIALGLRNVDYKKPSDFKFLQASIFIFWLALVIVLSFTDEKIAAENLVSIIIPTLFLIATSVRSLSLKSIAIVCMFILSVGSIFASANRVDSSIDSSVQQSLSALNKAGLKSAVSTHEIAYPITVSSKDKIVVSPFDKNNFNIQRNKLVAKNIEAIIIQIDSKSQSDFVLCTQSYIGHGFKKVMTRDLDIYVVDRASRSKIAESILACNSRT